MQASCAPTLHSFIGMLMSMLLILMLAARCSAQMVTYDVSNGEDFTKGEFIVTCPAGSYCMLPNKPGFESSSYASDRVDLDLTAYPGNATYYWNSPPPQGPSLPDISGKGCKGDKCVITCDTGCSCQLGPSMGSGISGEMTQDCDVVETLPDASIPRPDELVAFGGASQEPDFIAVRCSGTFIRPCTTAPFSDGSYLSLIGGVDPEYDYAVDFTDCSSADDGGVCYEACDPRCECMESKGNETMSCATGTALPTAFPTVAPTPTNGGEKAGKSSFIVAASIPIFAIIAVSFS